MIDETAHNSDEEWRKKLTPEQFRVMREKGTEPAGTEKHHTLNGPGVYTCAACDAELFSSDAKFDSGSGWPSFYQPVRDGALTTKEDTSLGMKRTEILCSTCGGHLGHVFDDGPTALPDGKPATGQRFCVNSVALNLPGSEK